MINTTRPQNNADLLETVMEEMIIRYALEAVLFLVFVSIYVFAVGTLLPRIFLKIKYTPGAPTDRGLRKYVFPEGRGIVYEPHPSIRRFVKLYILFVKDGAKYVRCKLADSVSFFGYAAVVFDNQNRVIDVVKVNDTVFADGTSRSVRLPKETSYIGFVLYSVNGKRLLGKEPFEYDAVKKKRFYIAMAAASAVMAVALRAATVSVIGIMGEYFDLVDISINILATLLVGIGAGLLCARSTVRKNWKNIVG